MKMILTHLVVGYIIDNLGSGVEDATLILAAQCVAVVALHRHQLNAVAVRLVKRLRR
jgi:hypothetical protein